MPVQTYYAASTGGFYRSDIHDAIPADAVEITEDLHTELIEGQSYGKIIAPPDVAHDLPWLADPPPPSLEELAAARRAKILARLAEIDAVSIRPLRAIAQGEATQADRDKLAALDAEAAELRAELAGLG
jgi:hypothetical protein